MDKLIGRAEAYVIKERADNGYYTDSVEVLDLVDDLVDRLKVAEEVVELTIEQQMIFEHILSDDDTDWEGEVINVIAKIHDVNREALAKYKRIKESDDE